MLTAAARAQAAQNTRNRVRAAVRRARLDRAVGSSVATEGDVTNTPSRNSGGSKESKD